MNMWCHLPTGFKARRTLLAAALALLTVVITTSVIFAHTSLAAPSTNKTMNFQGRLLNSSGGTVPDGNYNLQFKIYQDGTGTTAGNPGGTLLWTENHINNGGTSGVKVKNGYFSVSLGSITTFGTSIDWNADTLWLSMNVGGSSASCTSFGTSPCAGDGEMLPMKRLAATPYAINSGQLEGRDASGFIQNNNVTPQDASFNLSGNGTAATLQGNTSVLSPSLDSIGAASTLSIGNVNASTISMGTSNTSRTINIGTGSAAQIVTLGSTASTSSLTLQGGTGGVGVYSNGGITFNSSGNELLKFHVNGLIDITTVAGQTFNVRSSIDGAATLRISDEKVITTGSDSLLSVTGAATFDKGITITGNSGLQYTTPGGYDMTTAISIPNYTVGSFGTVMAFGLPASSSSTAHGLLVADARTGQHQATIGILSPSENNIFGLSYNGTESGYLSNTGNSVVLQGNSLDLLTATNQSGEARVGIGTTAPTANLHVTTNNSTVNQPQLKVEQQGAGDAAIEFKDGSGKSFYVGMDSSNGSTFKISSSTSLQTSTNIGNTVPGASQNPGLGNTMMTKKVSTGSVTGTVSSISLYVSQVDTAAPGVKVGLYSHDAANNRPGNLLAGTDSQNLSVGWNTIALSAPVTANTTYWIAMKSEGESRYMYGYCGGCAGEAAYYNSAMFTDAWLSSAGTPTNISTNENYSWYMSVTYGEITDTFSSTDLFNLTDTGSLTLQNSTNSASAFQIQNAAGSSMLNVDTTNNLIAIGAGVGIGNGGNSSYALDVTGDVNTSSQYRINGNSLLTESALTFQGGTASSILSATNQTLTIDGDLGITLAAGGQSRILIDNEAVTIGDGSGVGDPTLLTLDSGSAAPTGVLGSMYYDSTLGKVQCYEADGWGACSDAPDTFMSLTPEYANAVMNGADIGTISSDLCSDQLNINDGSSGQPTICGTDETQNFYKWTTAESTDQTRGIYVSYQLPSNFKEFVAGSTALMGRTDSSNATVTFQVYRDSPSEGLISCGGTPITVSNGSVATWQSAAATGGADPSTCGFEASDSMLIRINLTARSNTNAYVSDLKFTYSND